MSALAGWYPQLDGQQRSWDGELWTERFAPGAPQTPASITNSISVDTMARPAYAAHGIWYWLLVGWWCGPTSFAAGAHKSGNHAIDPDNSQSWYRQSWGAVASTHTERFPGGLTQSPRRRSKG